MKEREDIVAGILASAGGELTGKIRLQKVVYLLDQLGLDSGFDFEYYHYGPFSRDLVNATEDAKAFGLVDERIGHRASDGAPFSIFHLKCSPKADPFGSLHSDQVGQLVSKLKLCDATVLELAATAHWLFTYERVADWEPEIEKRKGAKCQGGRLEKAIRLLQDLSLPPAVAA